MELFRYIIVEGDSEKGALHIRANETLENERLWCKNLRWLKVPREVIDTNLAGTYEFWFKRRGARIFKARCLCYYKEEVRKCIQVKKRRYGGVVLYEDEFQVVIMR